MAKKTPLSQKAPAPKIAKAKAAKRAAPKIASVPKKGVSKKNVPAPKQKAPAKKPPVHPEPKRPVSKPAVKKPTPKKPAPVIAPKKMPPKPVAQRPAPEAPKPPRIPPKHKFDQKTLDAFRDELLQMRDRLTNQAGSMKNAALQRTDEENPEEDGTDAFMRLQTLEQVSSQQEILQNIDTALRAIAQGVYGVCDNCGELISRQRLQVLPFAKNCINCQAEMERMNRGGC